MKNGLIATLVGGLIAGTLDILYAFVIYGPLSYDVPPMRILQSVGAGWIGRDASRAGEWNTALFGLGSHFLIATLMAGVFVLLASAIKPIRARPILFGFLYGFILYVAMNYIVVPLSAAGANGHFAASLDEAVSRLQDSFSEVRGGSPDHPWMIWGTLFTHTVLVGMPIGWATKKFAGQSA